MFLVYGIVLIVILFIASVFACLETATVAVSEHRLMSLAKTKSWAKYALVLKKELDRILIFSLFGNSLFNAALTTLSTMLILEAVKDSGHWVLTLATLMVTLIIIIFSEATPKIIASKSPLNVLRFISIPLYYIFIVSKPIIWLIDRIVYGFTRLVGVGAADGTSLDDLRAIVEDKRIPFIEKHRSILKNSVEFDNILIKDVVVPLRQVEMIDICDDVNKNIAKLAASHHGNIIVYQKSVDNLIGYIKTRDLLSGCLNHSEVDLTKVLRKITFVQDFLPIVKQLPLLQHAGQSIFAVVNEYGAVLGIATIFDMVEVVFGSLTTDAPSKKNLIIKKSNTEYIVDGAALIRDLNDLYALELPIEFDALSVNGLINKYLRMIPRSGVCLKLGNTVFEVMQANDFGVERVRLIIV